MINRAKRNRPPCHQSSDSRLSAMEKHGRKVGTFFNQIYSIFFGLHRC